VVQRSEGATACFRSSGSEEPSRIGLLRMEAPQNAEGASAETVMA
jgi:hypothetical protein